VIILGAGFGGIAGAVRLRQRLPNAEIVLVDRAPLFTMGLRKTWELVGRTSPGEGARPLAGLERLGITVRIGVVESIDPERRQAVVAGELLEADALLVALGAQPITEPVPGYAHAARPYSTADLPAARAALSAFDGGNVVVAILGAPYPCPPGPFELALLVQEGLKTRGLSPEVKVISPLPLSLPALGPAASASFAALVAERGVTFVPSTTVERIEPGVFIAGGERQVADLLFVVPPYRVPPILVESGLAPEGGWVAVHPRTLETGYPGVWAIGDCAALPMTTGMAVPKAGALAEAQGEVAAERIAATLAGSTPSATFDGQAVCYIELGGGDAAAMTGHFLDDPPHGDLSRPSADWMDAKEAFERERLVRWFGA
jgi:sulfide:quinone oxidoreductase